MALPEPIPDLIQALSQFLVPRRGIIFINLSMVAQIAMAAQLLLNSIDTPVSVSMFLQIPRRTVKYEEENNIYLRQTIQLTCKLLHTIQTII